MQRFDFEIPCFQAKFKNDIPAIESHLTKKKHEILPNICLFIIAILKTNIQGVPAD
jgi:hypothetical protein